MKRTTEALDEEWAELASSAAGRAALERWALIEPDLAGVAGDLHELLELRRHPATFAGVLTALARLARTDRLAARAILQALLPGLVTVAGRYLGRDPQAVEEVLALAWERIRTYPSGRPGPVTGNVLWDVRKAYLEHREVDQPRRIPLQGCVTADTAARSPEDIVLDHEFVRELAEAHLLGVVTEQGVRAVLATRIAGLSVAEAAAREGLRPQGLKMRRWRAEAGLRNRLGLAG